MAMPSRNGLLIASVMLAVLAFVFSGSVGPMVGSFLGYEVKSGERSEQAETALDSPDVIKSDANSTQLQAPKPDPARLLTELLAGFSDQDWANWLEKKLTPSPAKVLVQETTQSTPMLAAELELSAFLFSALYSASQNGEAFDIETFENQYHQNLSRLYPDGFPEGLEEDHLLDASVHSKSYFTTIFNKIRDKFIADYLNRALVGDEKVFALLSDVISIKSDFPKTSKAAKFYLKRLSDDGIDPTVRIRFVEQEKRDGLFKTFLSKSASEKKILSSIYLLGSLDALALNKRRQSKEYLIISKSIYSTPQLQAEVAKLLVSSKVFEQEDEYQADTLDLAAGLEANGQRPAREMMEVAEEIGQTAERSLMSIIVSAVLVVLFAVAALFFIGIVLSRVKDSESDEIKDDIESIWKDIAVEEPDVDFDPASAGMCSEQIYSPEPQQQEPTFLAGGAGDALSKPKNQQPPASGSTQSESSEGDVFRLGSGAGPANKQRLASSVVVTKDEQDSSAPQAPDNDIFGLRGRGNN